MIQDTESKIYASTVDNYTNTLPAGYVPDPEATEDALLKILINNIHIENAGRDKMERMRIPNGLPADMVARLLLGLYPIINLSYMRPGEDKYTEVALYQDSGPDKGLYVTDTKTICKLIRRYNSRFVEKDLKNVMCLLSNEAPVRHRTMDPNLIAVNNGIFDYKEKNLIPFSPEYVFTSKSGVDYNPLAANPVIHNDGDGTDWDIESWMATLTDDPSTVDLLWKITGALIRPNIPWNKSPWLYSTSGNNGKGTLCKLWRNICGASAWTSIPLSNMGREFMLEQLTHVSAVINDENDTGTYIDKAANLKAIITHDPCQINRKNKQPITLEFRGLVVQCINELPRVKDKSDSLIRRLLIIPFDKRFEGCERKYIKDEYLDRRDVLEYVLRKVLTMDSYYDLPEPEGCLEALDEFSMSNDPIRQFLSEILPKARWQALPYQLLWDMYLAWFKHDNPAGSLCGYNGFVRRAYEAVTTTPEWGWAAPDRKSPIYIRKGWMSCYEPLLEEFDLTAKWGADPKSPTFSTTAIHMATPGNRWDKENFRCIVRMKGCDPETAKELSGDLLAWFAEWFWRGPLGGFQWYMAGKDESGSEKDSAYELATNRDEVCRAVTWTRGNFPQHALLDGIYAPRNEAGTEALAVAAQDYWFREEAGEESPPVDDGTLLDEFADWFWKNGVVEYHTSEPVMRIVPPEEAKEYVLSGKKTWDMMCTAIKRYPKAGRDRITRLYRSGTLVLLVQRYWVNHYEAGFIAAAAAAATDIATAATD